MGDVSLKPGDDGYVQHNPVLGVPTSKEYGYGASDYYFGCVKIKDNIYDQIPQMFVGRFCVAPNLTNGLEELENVIGKSIFYESEYCFGGWRDKVSAANGTILHSDYWETQYYPFLDRLTKEKELHYANCFDICSNGQIPYPMVDVINEGPSIFINYCHGGEENWESGLTAQILKNLLNNKDKIPFCFTNSCSVGSFQTHKCLSQQMTTYSDDKGFSGIISASVPILNNHPVYPTITRPPERSHERFPYFVYEHNIHIAGEAFLATFLNNLGEMGIQIFNILGDPSINLMSKGFEITKDVTVVNQAIISCPVYVRNATLSIMENSTLAFMPEGQLIIEEKSSLDIRLGGIVTALNVQGNINNLIKIKGGNFLADNANFVGLKGGIILENNQSSLIYGNYIKQYDLTGITFNNTPLSNCNTILYIYNCIFTKEVM